jgi:DNA-binding transcriptional ArsR family regulator
MDLVFRAIADSTRRDMLVRLTRGELSVGELQEGTGMSQPAISQHLKVLREAGLVADRAQGRSRLYRLRPQGLKAIFDWARTFEAYWDEHLDILEQILEDGDG